MNHYLKRLAKFILRFSVTAGLLIWIFRQIDLEEFWHIVEIAQWKHFVILMVLIVISNWMEAIKMKLILKKQDCNISVNAFFGISAIQVLYALILPGLFSHGLKWFLLKKYTGKGYNVFCSLVYNQLSMMAARIGCACIVLTVTNPAKIVFRNIESQFLLPAVCATLLVVTFLVFLLLLNPKAGGRIISGIGFVLRPFPVKLRYKIKQTLVQLTAFQHVSYRFHFFIGAFNILLYLFIVFSIFGLSAKIVNLSVPMDVFVWLGAIMYFLNLVPVSTANLGIREITLVGILPFYGVEKSAALLMSMVIFFSGFFTSLLVGSVYQIIWCAYPDKLNQSTSKFSR